MSNGLPGALFPRLVVKSMCSEQMLVQIRLRHYGISSKFPSFQFIEVCVCVHIPKFSIQNIVYISKPARSGTKYARQRFSVLKIVYTSRVVIHIPFLIKLVAPPEQPPTYSSYLGCR